MEIDQPKPYFKEQSISHLSADEVRQLYADYLNPGFIQLGRPFKFSTEIATKAQGCWIWTDSGRKVLDMTGGVGVLRHGHNHPRLLKVRRRFQDELRMEVHKQFLCPEMALLAKRLAELLPEDLRYSFFCNSGAEAVDGALKLAFKFHNGHRRCVLHSNIAFHGKLLGAGSLSTRPEVSVEFPKIPNVHEFSYNDIESVRNLIQKLRKANGESDVYALVLEPFNAGNLRECWPQFLRSVEEICAKENIVLIFDEVYSGWYATGDMFAFQRSGAVPDILLMSKSFGGGKASISAYTAKKNVFLKTYGDAKNALVHTTTYNGFAEECATALEAINISQDENFAERTQQLGQHLQGGLRRLAQGFPDLIQEVRGRGVLQGLVLKTPMINSAVTRKFLAAAVVNELYEKHSVLSFFQMGQDTPLVISPPAVCEFADIDLALRALHKTFQAGPLQMALKLAKNLCF